MSSLAPHSIISPACHQHTEGDTAGHVLPWLIHWTELSPIVRTNQKSISKPSSRVGLASGLPRIQCSSTPKPAAGPTDGPVYVRPPTGNGQTPAHTPEQARSCRVSSSQPVLKAVICTRQLSITCKAAYYTSAPRRSAARRIAPTASVNNSGGQGGPGNKARNRTAEVLGAAD